MPSHSHMEPLTVGRAMRPITSASRLPEKPYAHPDDALDEALQRMGKSHVEELVVIARDGGARVGVLNTADAFAAYKDAPEGKQLDAPAVQNWLPAVAAITVAAILIVSGLVFLQKSRRVDQGIEAYQTGQKLLAQGQDDEAVAAFRNALAHNSQDTKSRAALGLALVEAGHYAEASAYLHQVVKTDVHNGPVWAAMARSR